MVGWRNLFGIVRECNRGMRLALSVAVRGSVEMKNSASLLRLRECVLTGDLLNRQTCRGHSVSPPNNIRVPYSRRKLDKSEIRR